MGEGSQAEDPPGGAASSLISFHKGEERRAGRPWPFSCRGPSGKPAIVAKVSLIRPSSSSWPRPGRGMEMEVSTNTGGRTAFPPPESTAPFFLFFFFFYFFIWLHWVLVAAGGLLSCGSRARLLWLAGSLVVAHVLLSCSQQSPLLQLAASLVAVCVLLSCSQRAP